MASWLFHPALMWGALAVAAPIIIHLLSRRRHRRVRWAAMEFLLAAHRRHRRRVQMEQWILLALRCLVILLLAILVARPFLRPRAALALLGSAPRSDRIVLLDDSASMGCQAAPDQRVFDRAKVAVQKLAGWCAQESPADSIVVLPTSDPGRPLASVSQVSPAAASEVRDRLAAAAVSDEPARWDRAAEEAARLLGRSAASVNAVLYVFSDFQKSDWASSASAEAGRSPLSAVAPLMDGPRPPSVILVDVGVESPRNLAVTSLEAVSPQTVSGVTNRFTVGVTNYSSAAVGNAELRISTLNRALPPIPLGRLAPGQTLRESTEIAFPAEGGDFVAAELHIPGESDGLAIDNRRTRGLTVAPAVEIVVVNGEPMAEPNRDEVFLLRTALSPAGRVASGNRVRTVEESQIESIDLRSVDVVMLANVFRLSPASHQRLEQFVADGGGLFVAVGDQADAAHYRDELFAAGAGLLPAGPTDAMVVAPRGVDWGMTGWDAAHPLFRSFAGPGVELLRPARFFAFAPLVVPPPAATTTMPAATSGPGGIARGPVRVLASLDDPVESPLLIERQMGAGRVLLLASSVDLEWNTWARSPSYVAFMLQVVQYLARSDRSAGEVLVGEALRLPADPIRFVRRAKLTRPEQAGRLEVELESRPSSEGGFVWEFERATQAGLYAFALTGVDGRAATRYVGANVDARESDLARCAPEELRRSVGMPVAYVSSLDLITGADAHARRELWWPLLWVIAGLLLTEHGLARWFGTRG